MSVETKIEQLQEAQLALDAALTALEKAWPEHRRELQEFLAGRVAELAAAHRADAKTDLTAHIAAARTDLAGMIERHMAAVLAKRQEMIGLAHIEPNLRALAEGVADEKLKQFSEKSDGQIRELAAKIPAPLASTPGAPEQPLSPVTYQLVDIFRGQWTAELVLKRGDLFTFRGSTYLALRDSRGVIPTKQNQKGAKPYYALFAATGAPGLPGQDLTPGGLTTLTDGATIAWNMNNAVAKVTLGGARTLTVSNHIAGGTYILHVIQDGTGSRTLTWPSSVKWPGNTAPTLTTTLSCRDIFTFTSDGTNLFGSYVQNYPAVS